MPIPESYFDVSQRFPHAVTHLQSTYLYIRRKKEFQEQEILVGYIFLSHWLVLSLYILVLYST